MSTSVKPNTRPSLALFFDERCSALSASPDQAELCFASGRDARLWARPALYEDLMQSLVDQLDLRPSHSLLEVGCAAGFIAKGIALRAKRYTGIDLAPAAVSKARSLGIPNATFQTADATALPFAGGTFDRVVCQDVVTNLESFEFVAKLIREMLRVTVPGGRVLIGSVPDEAQQPRFQQQVAEVSVQLEREHGPPPAAPQARPSWWHRVQHWYQRRVKHLEPGIICYYFRRQDFQRLGQELGAPVSIEEIHAQSPYHGMRFNAIYTNQAA